MKVNFYYIIFTLLLIAFSCHLNYVYSQADSTNYWEISLDKLSKTNISDENKKTKNTDEVFSKFKVITKQEILNRGYISIDEVLSDIEGFQFRNIQGFNSYIFMRGMPSQNNYIILMINGIPINEINSGGFYAGNMYDINNVEKIEILYGPSSTLFGSNAISGVINIVTKGSNLNDGLSASTSYGSNNTLNYNASFRYFNPKTKMGISIAGMYNSTNKENLAGEFGDNNWTENFENFENNYSLEVKANVKNLEIGANLLNKMSSRTTQFKSYNSKYQDYGTNWDIIFGNIYVKYQKKLSDKILINTKAYYRNSTVRDITISHIYKPDTFNAGKQFRYYRPNYLFGSESFIKYNPNKFYTALLGIIYENETISDGFSITESESYKELPQIPLMPSLFNNSNLGIFLVNNMNLLKYLKLNLSARYDYSTNYEEVISPNAGLIFSRNKFFAKLIYTQAFRAPKNWDYTYGNGNPDLESEHINSYELNTGYYFSENIFCDISLYNNDLINGITKNIILNRWENTSKINIKGGEAGVKYKGKIINYYLNYSYSFPTDENNNKIAEISEHVVNSGITFRKNKFILDISSNYFSSKLNPSFISTINSNISDGALLLNSTLSLVKIKSFNFKLSVKNILDTEYYHTSNTSVSRYRQLGRNYLFTVFYNFR